MVYFDDLVKKIVAPEVLESYHDIAKRHLQQELSVKQFKANLEQLFKPYKDILELLPFLFSDVQNSTHQEAINGTNSFIAVQRV